MEWSYEKALRCIELEDLGFLLTQAEHGAERESLRIRRNGELAQTPHPKSLGSALTNRFFTTDGFEAHLEIVTPPLSSETKLMKHLTELHQFGVQNMKRELLWPASMPGRLPNPDSISPANYGHSFLAQQKHIYSHGLNLRYGRKMHTVSGIHYNHSLSPGFWEALHHWFAKDEDLATFVSEGYLALARNFKRLGWLYTYLFGASPCVDQTYLDARLRKVVEPLDKESLYLPEGTSLRVSQYGYYQKPGCQPNVSLNSLNRYITDLEHHLNTPEPKFSRIGVYRNGRYLQLNDRKLQLASEYYSRIRPKRLAGSSESCLQALQNRGIGYLEVRCCDLDLFHPLGTSLEHFRFLHLFLLYCLLKESPLMGEEEAQSCVLNQNQTALYGLSPNLKLWRQSRRVKLRDWAEEVLSELEPLADRFPTKTYSKVLAKQWEKVHDHAVTPSAKMIAYLQRKKAPFSEVGVELAQKHRQELLGKPLSAGVSERLRAETRRSIEAHENLEALDEHLLYGYEDLGLSTQGLLREAFTRGLETEVLDRRTSFLRISRGQKTEYIQGGVATSLNPQISEKIAKNHQVCRSMLERQGLVTPLSQVYRSVHEGLSCSTSFSGKTLLRPETNREELIYVATKQKLKGALDQLFKNHPSVVREAITPGKEYRFLVVGEEVVAVSHLEPAHVRGNGSSTTAELIQKKNRDPLHYKHPKNRIHIGGPERSLMRQQGWKLSDIPPKGKKITFRHEGSVTTGADPIDMTDAIHSSYKELALIAACAIEARVCGVDMVIRAPKQHAHDNNYAILNVTLDPALYIHSRPFKGKGRPVEKALLDLLGF